MPKKDRAAEMAKETKAAKKKINADSAKSKKEADQQAEEARRQAEEEEREERAKAKQRAPSKFEQGLAAGRSKSTFSNAASASAVNEDDDEYDDQVAPAEPTFASPAASPPTSNKKDAKAKKTAKKGGFQDEMAMLAQEQATAKRERIVGRFLRLLAVGYFLENKEEAASKQPVKQESKGKKKAGKAAAEGQDWSVQSLMDKAGLYQGPIMMLLFLVFIFGARIAGEDFSPDWNAESVDHYGALELPNSADVLAVRKAYKALALTWHPDKNPGCEECVEKFDKISKAYEVLSNPERKEAYDQRKSHADGSQKSAASVDLTDEDFETKVLRSNDVWFVQIYDPSDGGTKSFHPAWEEVAQANQATARFGRVDATKHKKAMALLPQRVIMMPVVFRFARGQAPELFQVGYSTEERGGQPLNTFVLEHFPEMNRFESADALKSWWKVEGSKPKVIVAGSSTGAKRARREFLQVQRLAQTWAEFFEVASADADVVKAALGAAYMRENGWAASMQGGVTQTASDVTVLADLMKEMVSKAVNDQVPSLTVRNHQQLCAPQENSRTYCLFLVDDDGSRSAKVVQELKSSHEAYQQELAEGRSEDDESTEEVFQIQPVRVMTSSSRWPWHPVAAGSTFKALWAEAKYSKAFVLELEGRRVAAVKTPNMQELFQQIAYEDLKFVDLSESLSLTSAMPDPEVRLKRELSRFLGSIPGALVAYVCLAAIVAVVPEFPLAHAGAIVALILSFLVAAWPIAFRKCVAVFWCVAASSRFECQV
jgi:hypothetical protein